MTLPIEDAQPAVKMVWHHASSEHPTLSDFVIYSGFVCLYAGSRYCVFTTASSLLIIFQRAKLSTRNITHFCWCNWRTFWRKNAAGSSPRCFVLARQCPGPPGTCNPEETDLPGLPVSWSPTLFSGCGPVGLLSVPWTEKTIEGLPFFVRSGGHCYRGDLVGRSKFWFFFEWLAKIRATG